ncbi:hypothetical protein THRCLA_22221 [Thraustotheca clavata]|uniref:RWP-RK domain-containing protein n=1 Tax=Thraustotheca clavata TaxID=74557 RepID=A0A1V9Z9H7_9STRA|nr:hypothetical protein THRCLA_22221 [Thraustotheca clavata]
MRTFPSIRGLSDEQLRELYHLPLKEAAEQLGSYEGALIRLCRQRNIPKWPYRQLAKIQRKINFLDGVLSKMDGGSHDHIQIRRANLLHQYNTIKYWSPKQGKQLPSLCSSEELDESDDSLDSPGSSKLSLSYIMND